MPRAHVKSSRPLRVLLVDNDFIYWFKHRIKNISSQIGIKRISEKAYEPLAIVVQAKLADTVLKVVSTDLKVITPELVTNVVGDVPDHPEFLPKAPFERLVRQLAQNGGRLEDKKWSAESLDILREYSEVLFMEVLTIAKLFVTRANQVVLTDKDIEMVVKSRTLCNRGPYM